METHEHELPDEDLPGFGIFTPEYIRDQLKEHEEAGLLLWDREEKAYRQSARALMVDIATVILATRPSSRGVTSGA